MCTHICLFKGNLRPEYERITPFHSVAGGEKEKILLAITSLIKDRLVNSNTSFQRQLTNWICVNHIISHRSKWGKGANHVTIIRSLHPSRINYLHSYMSIQRKLTFWVRTNHTISQCSKWRKGANHVTIIRSLVKDRLCTLKYVHSKATYRLSMSESHHFTV